MEGSTKKTVTTNGYATTYYEGGAGDPVILIHGGGAGADAVGNWTSCWPHVTARKHVYAFDLVGFGNSDAPDPSTFAYTQAARNDQLIAFIEALGLERVSIVGNSMGGATALGAAMRRPELIANLVLMGSAGLNRQTTDPALAVIVNYDFTLEGMRKIAAALADDDFVPSEAMLQTRYELSIKPATRAAYAATMGWIKDQRGLHYEDAEIAAVKTRTLIFNGKNDRVVPMADAFHFLELLENSTGYFLPRCGHWAMIERPETFARITLDFLDHP